jgi:hypothetical protein
VNNTYFHPTKHHLHSETLSDVKNSIHDGAQSYETNTLENENLNSNLMECDELYKKISLHRGYSLATNVEYTSCNRSVSEKKSLIQCVKSRDFHMYNRISAEKINGHRFHSFKKPPDEIGDLARDNSINNNTAGLMKSNKDDISRNINSISGIKRNCGRILPIPSSSTRPLSIKLPFHTSKINEDRNRCLKDTKVTHSQARPLSIVLPTPRYNMNHSLNTILPTDKSSHLSKLIPSPKIHPLSNPYQRMRCSTNENVCQADELNNNSNLVSHATDTYNSTSVASLPTPGSDGDRVNNNICTSRSVSHADELKPGPKPLTENTMRLKSGFNSSNLISVQKHAYPSTVLCTGQNSRQISMNYPSFPNASCHNHNVSTTLMPSTHSSNTTTPSPSSPSVVHSLPDQPSVLLVVYPVPFVNESNELLMEQQQRNAENNEEVTYTCQQSPKESRCGIQ